MSESSITYLGPPQLQNGHIIGFHRAGDRATVRIRGADGHHLSIEFAGVADLVAARPEGMLLHGVAELRPADSGRRGALRHFIFANEEEWDDAYLEIAARDVWIESAERPEPID